MKSWSVKRKLGTLCSFLLGIVILVGTIEYLGMRTVVGRLDNLGNVQLPAVRTMTLADMMHDGLRATVYRAILSSESTDANEKAEVQAELKEMSQNLRDYVAKLSSLALAPGTLAAIDESKPAIENYIQQAESIVTMSVAGQRAAVTAKLPEFQRAFSSLEVGLEKMGDLIQNEAEVNKREGEAEANWIILMTEIVIGISLLIGVFASIWIARDLVRTLSGVISNLENTSQNLTAASGQSASLASELSEAAVEQSASLQETMASIEEISAMVNQNAESASKARATVEANAQATSDGQKNVTQMLEAIREIKATNDEVLGQMESSNREFADIVKIIGEIGEKTKVINDIVFQTKLLSFNASVEAARAGEHGKGFAVVAQEVGSLANMSGKAAKEISDMLSTSTKTVDDIVRATTARVDQLIEVGKDKIAMGQSTADRCREALERITANAQSVSQIVAEIASASREQAQGVQEINKAISQLDQVTQQNSVVAQQSSSQAESLNADAEGLSVAVTTLAQFVAGVSDSAVKPVAPAGSKRSLAPVGRVISMAEHTRRRATTSSRPNTQMKKAVGESVPSANDPNFEEF